MSAIKVTPEQLRSVSNQFKRASEESQNLRNTLNGEVRGLQGEWAGLASNKFAEGFEQWEQDMMRYSEMLEAIGIKLEQVATTFQETDERIASQV